MVENYNKNVFINCPFDDDYLPIFNAIQFTVHRCGFVLRCSKEFGESSTIRIQNIIGLIEQSRYSIHDLSRVSTMGDLPRFNMPLELGICIGAIAFGQKNHKSKKYLILEKDRYRFQQFISDLSGQDIQDHNNYYKDAVKAVRNWLSSLTSETVPSPSIIITEYDDFLSNLPALCQENKWLPNELTFQEFSNLVISWLSTSD